VVEWLTATHGGVMATNTFIAQMGEYATKDRNRAQAAALILFAFDAATRRAVGDEYNNPTSIGFKLIQYADLNQL
jgi:hypothetical protein